MTPAWLSPAGGIRYHLRALRYRPQLWAGFTRPLAEWLSEWQPREERLLLVGPSAGYCLPEETLARFAVIDAVEPDPLARALFMQRFPSLAQRLRWHADDYFHPAARLVELRLLFPAHAVLFSNVLGQLDLASNDERWKETLEEFTCGRSWLSFHDRLSGPLRPQLVGMSPPFAPTVSNDELAARLWPRPPSRLELEDHGTEGLFRHAERRYFVWHLRPDYFHLIEGVRDDG